MRCEDLLLSLSQLGLGLAGFAGIVGVFRRSNETLVPQDFFGLRVILELTLASVFFGLIPPWAFLAFSDEPTALQLSSLLLAIFFIVDLLIEVGRLREHKRRGFPPRHPSLLFWLLFVPEVLAFGLLIVNAIWLANDAVYIGPIIYLLFAASVQFFVLVSSPKTEPLESEMPQTNSTVPLVLINGLRLLAFVTGNNAAWLCPCGYQNPLIGKSGNVSGATSAAEVHCPFCKKRYFVVPDGGDQVGVLRVDELQ
jgi:hypothetical protein